MRELLTNAWYGWQQFTDKGKFAALLLAVLLFLWFYREKNQKKEMEENRFLLIYATLMTVLCIFPVSAMLLMKYQTGFYDYVWVWSYVPMTMVIAYGGTVFLGRQWESYGKSKLKCAGIAVAGLALLLLCGGMGQMPFDAEAENQERGAAQEVLGSLAENVGDTEICLWAPKEIMAEARAFDGGITLIYGRNMWDAALGGYSYETYGEVEEALYLWMCHAEDTGETIYTAEQSTVAESPEKGGVAADEQIITGVWCVETARTAGVNCILLPGQIAMDALQPITAAVGAEPVLLGDYYLYVLR